MLHGELLTVKEVLEMSGVSRYTLYRDINSKKIPVIYFGRNVRFKIQDAENYAKEKKGSRWVNLWKEKKSSTQQKI